MNHRDPSTGPPVRLRTPYAVELRAVADFLGDAMAENPNHLAAHGAARAATRHALLMRAFLSRRRMGSMVAAFRGGEVVGFVAATRSPWCQPSGREVALMLPTLLRLGPPSLARVLAWQRAWGRHHPAGEHLHVGPLAVRQDLRGRGLGRQLLEVALQQGAEDVRGGGPSTAYLETDREANVGFYRAAGFAVCSEGRVLGRPNWFLERSLREFV